MRLRRFLFGNGVRWIISIGILLIACFAAIILIWQSKIPKQVSPSRGMVTGNWRRGAGVSILVDRDGKFSEHGLFVDAGEASTLNIPKSGSGRWRISSSEIIFSFSSGPEMDWMLERDGSGLALYYDDENPGQPDQFILRKLFILCLSSVAQRWWRA